MARGDMTPDTLPSSSSSRASTIADEDLDGGSYSRPTTATSMTSARFSLDSLPSNWKHSSNSRLSTSSPRYSLLKKPFAFVEDVEEEEEQQEEINSSEQEEDTIQTDIAFQRLSMLLAGLQAQAEAAVFSPTSSLRQPGALDPPVEVEEEEELSETLFPGMSRPTPPSTAATTNNDMGSNASGPGTAQTVPSFHRTSSLPFIAPRPSRRTSRIIINNDQDSTDPFTVPFSPRMPLSPMVPLSVSVSSPPAALPKFELPPTPPPTLRKRPTGLDLTSLKAKIPPAVSSPAPHPKSVVTSASPSPALITRHNSYLVKDTDLEGLLNEFLEITQMRNREAMYDVMFRCVWIYLLGGGFVWTAVGWMLGWGCRECRGCMAAPP